jgi:hypothetical protein
LLWVFNGREVSLLFVSAHRQPSRPESTTQRARYSESWWLVADWQWRFSQCATSRLQSCSAATDAVSDRVSRTASPLSALLPADFRSGQQQRDSTAHQQSNLPQLHLAQTITSANQLNRKVTIHIVQHKGGVTKRGAQKTPELPENLRISFFYNIFMHVIWKL